jgi:nucleoside-diphosphate-sugar epimerase
LSQIFKKIASGWMDMAKIFVSGASGFIGGHVSRRMREGGHQVHGLVRKSSDLTGLRGMDINLCYGDITDPQSLTGVLQGMDIVVHVAGLASDWGPFPQFNAVNVEGTQNLARAAHESRVKRFVHISSTAIHGFNGFNSINENHPTPVSWIPYCETKRRAEAWLFSFADQTGMEICAIRPGNVFGPYDFTFIQKYLDLLVRGKGGYIDGGRHLTCPTYVENLVDGIAKACFEPAAAGEAFLITDGLFINWKEFTERLTDALGIDRPKLSIPFWLGYGIATVLEKVYALFRSKHPPLLTRYRVLNGGRDYHFSIDKAAKYLKYAPTWDLEAAVDKTIRWYQDEKKGGKSS